MKKQKNYSESQTFQQQRTSSLKTMIYLAILSSGIVFLFLTIAIISLSKSNPTEIQMPKAFFVSTILLLVSNFMISSCPNLFKAEQLKKLQKTIVFALLLAVSFLGFQYWAWLELIAQGIFFDGNASGSFIYIVSGFHFLHALAGILFIGIVHWDANKASSNAVKGLIYVSNSFEKTKMDLMHLYWSFVDLLWLILFVFMLFYF